MSAAQNWPRPLEGVRIVDFSVLLPGPHCTQLLVQMGAEVIKVEPPGGDPVRAMNPHAFALLNRGKKSVCIDAKTPDAQEFLLRLIADADVVVEGFRPGVMDGFGLGFEQARDRNPRVIYASISGYGQDGPYARRPGHDLNFLAAAGYFASTLDLDDATLQRPRLRISDYFAAMSAAFSIAALLRTPREQRAATRLDASMFDTMASLTLPSILSMTPEAAADPTLRDDVMPDVALYRTADDRAISIGTLEDKFWQVLIAKLGHRFPQLHDPAWAGRQGRTCDKQRLAATLREMFGAMTLAEIEQALPTDELCWTPVLRGAELLQDPQVLAHGLVARTAHGLETTSAVALNGVRAPAGAAVPELGAHLEELWLACGMPAGAYAGG
jgi:crotonobetainyl-CoA:carnitine CoA-transferase CaiB-like acyl-CoA transferase